MGLWGRTNSSLTLVKYNYRQRASRTIDPEIEEAEIMNKTLTERATFSAAQKVVNAVWPYVTGKRGLIVLAVAVVGAGMIMNWSWLVAIGAAPLLLAILPCAAMCALGLCMNHGRKDSCSKGVENKKQSTADQVDVD